MKEGNLEKINNNDLDSKERKNFSIRIEDSRNPEIPSALNTDELMEDIGRFINPQNVDESFGSNKYGQYLSLATNESDTLRESLAKAKGIIITVTNTGESLLEKKKDLTTVRFYCLKDEKTGIEIKMYFNPDGTFYNGNYYLKSSENKNELGNDKGVEKID